MTQTMRPDILARPTLLYGAVEPDELVVTDRFETALPVITCDVGDIQIASLRCSRAMNDNLADLFAEFFHSHNILNVNLRQNYRLTPCHI